MINKLNLASRPFRNRTLPYLIVVFLLVCTLFGVIFSFAQWNKLSSENELANSDIQEMEEKLEGENAKAENVKQSLSPDQQRLMIAGHKLVAHKQFGWSRLLSDIERVLPGNVSASRINVENVYKENDRIKAELDFSVLSRNYPAVVNMIDRMNDSGVFRASLRSQDRQESDTITYSEYSLNLIYQPSAGFSTTPPTESAAMGETTERGTQ